MNFCNTGLTEISQYLSFWITTSVFLYSVPVLGLKAVSTIEIPQNLDASEIEDCEVVYVRTFIFTCSYLVGTYLLQQLRRMYKGKHMPMPHTPYLVAVQCGTRSIGQVQVKLKFISGFGFGVIFSSPELRGRQQATTPNMVQALTIHYHTIATLGRFHSTLLEIRYLWDFVGAQMNFARIKLLLLVGACCGFAILVNAAL